MSWRLVQVVAEAARVEWLNQLEVLGGGGAIQQVSYIFVSPGTTYTVKIGAGGSGSAGGTGGIPGVGSDGSPTIVSFGSTNLFYTLGAGGAGLVGNFNLGATFNPFAAGAPFSGTRDLSFTAYGGGGFSQLPSFPGVGGCAFIGAPTNYIGGFPGGTEGSNLGGTGGGAGPQGAGGNGGNTAVSGNGGNGSTPAANSAAGGGGGGGGDNAGGNGGNGGSGGSGYLYLVY